MVVVGEALMDVVHGHDGLVQELPGGSAANVAITLARLGRVPTLVTCLGEDARGHRLRRWLNKSGVHIDPGSFGNGPTSTAVARLDATGSASYEFGISWNLDGRICPGADVLHTGSIATLLAPGAEVVTRWVTQARSQATIIFDPNLRPSILGDRAGVRRSVEGFVGLADAVKVSDEDLRWLYPGRDPLDAVLEWHSRGPGLVVLTAGANGALAASAAGLVSCPAPRVTVVDTVGAGDTFTGALVDGLLRAGLAGACARDRLRAVPTALTRELLQRCAAAAAVTVSRRGANPPHATELSASSW